MVSKGLWVHIIKLYGGCLGELMQLESCRDEQGRFNHYLQKTFMKTASLMAYSCQAVSLQRLTLLAYNTFQFPLH